MTVREICKAHNVKTLDEQDELLCRLAQDRDALLSVLNSVNECLVAHGSIDADTPMHHHIEATIQQSERNQ